MPGPDLQAAFIPSASHTLLGGLYRAAHPPSRPAVLLLHGLPGHEKNLDVAVDLQDHGIHCLYVHYRGSWGSAGGFSIAGLAADATAALDWLTARPEVDPQRVAVVGFSLGGWVALALSASRPGVAACVAVAPLIDPRSVPLPADLAAESAATLHGATPQSLTQQWAALPPATEFGDSLRGTPLLLVTADADELFPPAHYGDLTAAIPGIEWVRFPRAGHTFAGVRPALRHVVADYLCRRFA